MFYCLSNDEISLLTSFSTLALAVINVGIDHISSGDKILYLPSIFMTMYWHHIPGLICFFISYSCRPYSIDVFIIIPIISHELY